jgi:hypothetical protein
MARDARTSKLSVFRYPEDEPFKSDNFKKWIRC